MLPVTHADLLVILAFTIAITVTGFGFMTLLVFRWGRESRQHFAEIERMTKAVAGMVYQEEEKTRELLRPHGWPD